MTCTKHRDHPNLLDLLLAKTYRQLNLYLSTAPTFNATKTTQTLYSSSGLHLHKPFMYNSLNKGLAFYTNPLVFIILLSSPLSITSFYKHLWDWHIYQSSKNHVARSISEIREREGEWEREKQKWINFKNLFSLCAK